jgi:hypothetical protein
MESPPIAGSGHRSGEAPRFPAPGASSYRNIPDIKKLAVQVRRLSPSRFPRLRTWGLSWRSPPVGAFRFTLSFKHRNADAKEAFGV